MKIYFPLLLSLAVAPGVATAQSAPDPDAPTTFRGPKIGASIDYRWLDGDYSLPRLNGRIDDKRGGVGYRGFVGYDAQAGDALVIGAEAGIGRGGKELQAGNANGEYSLKPRWNWDVSGRAGILPSPNVLLYGRAGYSWLRVREKTDFSSASVPDVRSSGTEKGFLWGAGIETKMPTGGFARGEYNRVNYGNGLTSSRVQLGLGMGF